MNIQEMMKQAKVMQTRMEEMQRKMGDMEVAGESGGGVVKVTMTCKGEVRALTIAPEVILPDDKETLEDLVKAAVNMARKNADQRVTDETQRMMKEFGLPTDFQLPDM